MSAIKHKRSAITGKVPLASDLLPGEIAINTTDIKLYTKNTAGAVTTVNSWENVHNKPEVVTSSVVELIGDPDSGDIPIGKWGIFRNLSNSSLSLWANNAGTLVKLTLS